MSKLLSFLAVFVAFLVPASAATVYPYPATRLVRGVGAPSGGTCAAIGDVGKVYIRQDAGATFSSLYTCDNTGVATYAWELYGSGGGGGSGTVTSVSVVTANGVSGSVATATTTPAITLTLGAITPTTVTASGAITAASVSTGTSPPAITPGTGGVDGYAEGTNPASGCVTAGVDCLVGNAAAHRLQLANNGTALSSVAVASDALTFFANTNFTGDATTVFPALTIGNGAITAVKMVNAGVFTGDAVSTFPAITISNNAITAAKMVNGGVFTGDVTTTFPAVTVAKVNGIAYSATAAAHSVEVITTANTTATAKVMPDCTDTGGNHINFTQSTDAFSCGTSGGSSSNAGVITWTIGFQTLATGTSYTYPGSQFVSISNTTAPMPVACTAQNLFIFLPATVNAGGNIVFTLYDNTTSATTALTVTAAAGATSAVISDTTHTVALTQGDRYALQIVNNSTATNAGNWSFSFQCK